MKSRIWLTSLGIAALLLAAAILASAVFFQTKPLVEAADNPRILSISATVETHGQTYDYDIPESGIAQALSDDLVALLRKADMQNTLFPPPQRYEGAEGSVYLTLKVSLDNLRTPTMRVNLCSDPLYTSVQLGDTHYHIVDGDDLYQKIYELVSPVIVFYAKPR